MHLAFSVALSALLCIEYVRFFRLWPFGPAIERFTSQFLDSKDTGPFLTSHLYLLVGCALPVWLESVANGAVMPTLAGCAGMLCLGVSDTLASVVGFLVGRHRWPASSKTIEGSLAFWLSGWAAALLLQRLVADYVPDAAGLAHVNLAPGGLDGLPTMPASAPWLGVVFAAAALLEACCDQNDNLVLPLYVYTILTRPLISQ
ncbi:hypothetical protein CXG81DRAFT_8771 [Caulochytrium protostelioides]|uniref:dolichol kinase n=1 Tax=Caulochytrium protostelioides TaxID=1555241 RepID=A0A4P9XEQ6_9FUNG|nr:hypothetical protein CXG81DRAFT_8771 [Caulochytrium protostelioides]|eukprot:RKP04034.1 hypothetical protein CXG81DRAFT_8771 [Caulochytrium protostelioides]